MPVNLPTTPDLGQVPGFQVGCAAAQVRYAGRLDVAVAVCEEGSVAGGVFTQNNYRAAPVIVAENHLGDVRALVVNSGNANAATGDRGLKDARSTCEHVAMRLGCESTSILPFSTGVIGEFLPMEKLCDGIDDALASRSSTRWNDMAHAILTTDTQPKGVASDFQLDGTPVRAIGVVKGSGMIRPNMATMLAFLVTNARISEGVANSLARDLSACSFNRLTIDGDTSTNDSFVLVASNQSPASPIEEEGSDAYLGLLSALTPVARELAIRTVRDGEGATKFVTIRVEGGRTEDECLKVAFAVANSPLVKTAIFAGDPNWGRFCMAIGNAGLPQLDPYGVSLYLDDVCVASQGMTSPEYVESAAAAVMDHDEYVVRIELNRGAASETVWTSDLSYDYIKINAEYRT